MERPLKIKQIGLIVLSVLCCVSGFAIVIYASLAVQNGATSVNADVFALFQIRLDAVIAFRVFSVVALVLSLLSLAASSAGLLWLEKAHISGVLQGMVFSDLL